MKDYSTVDEKSTELKGKFRWKFFSFLSSSSTFLPVSDVDFFRRLVIDLKWNTKRSLFLTTCRWNERNTNEISFFLCVCAFVKKIKWKFWFNYEHRHQWKEKHNWSEAKKTPNFSSVRVRKWEKKRQWQRTDKREKKRDSEASQIVIQVNVFLFYSLCFHLCDDLASLLNLIRF